MGKPKRERELADTEAQAVTWNIRVSPRKLNLVAASIRGEKAASAVAALTFSKKRIAGTVKKTLESAIANAENNHRLDVDQLVVAKAEVGRAQVMKRFHARGRGRSSQIEKWFSHLKIVVTEAPDASAALPVTRTGGRVPVEAAPAVVDVVPEVVADATPGANTAPATPAGGA